MTARPPEFGRARLRRLELTVVGGVAVFVAGLAVAAAFAGVDAVAARLAETPWTVIAAMLGLSLVNYALRIARWQAFSVALGLKVGLGANATLYVAGFALTTTPGKAGEALRLWLLARGHGVPYARGAALFLADRLSDMAAILILAALSAGAFAGYAEATLLAAIGVAALLALFARPRTLIAFVTWVWARGGRRASRTFGRVRHAVRTTATLLRPGPFGLGLVLALAGWGAEAWSFHLLLDALAFEASLAQSVFVFTFAMIAGSASAIAGGLGGAEATMLALLAALGMPFDQAVAATALIRATTLWFAVALGFVALPLALRRVARGPGAPA